MKTLIITCIAVFTLLFSLPSQSNPIPPPNLVVEVYFESGEWVLVIDNMYAWAWGLETFEDVVIFCSGGSAEINPNVVPDPDEYVTLLTVDDLTQPLDIDPVEDHVGVWIWEGYTLCDLEWGPDPDDIVSGPEPWQSVIISCVAASPDWDYIFWPVKGAAHNCYTGGCSRHGVFTGIVTDQYSNPMPDAEICYLPDGLLFSDYGFSHIITNASGQYQHNYMPARNYHIHKIVFDSVEYLTDEYISIEPNDTVNLDFTIYTTQTAERELQKATTLSNFPNPFKTATTFTINLPEISNSALTLEVCDISGKMVTSIKADSKIKSQSLYWNAGSLLPTGQYLVILKSDQQIMATHKITIE